MRDFRGHPAQPRPRLVVAACAGAIQLGGLCAYAAGVVAGEWIFLATHIIGAALVAAVLSRGRKRGREKAGFALLYGMIGALLPVAGPACAFGLDRILYDKLDEHERPDHIVWDNSVTHHVPAYSVDADIDALKDRLQGGMRETRSDYGMARELAGSLPYRLRDKNPEVRREAIRPLARLRTDHAASILREILGDEDEQVRLLAQNAMQSIRDRHDEIVTGLANSIESHPDDPLNRLRLADSYSALADMNLERDAEVVAQNRARAAAELDAAAALTDPAKDTEMSLRLLRRSLILGRVDMARRFSERVGNRRDMRLRESLAEIAYLERNLPEMRARLRSLSREPMISPLFRDVREHWIVDDKTPRKERQ